MNLKYIDNPFENEIFNSINCFAWEKSFYDCINRKFLGDFAFKNLEYTFYMYLLTGDNNEWIGYVLFSNVDRVIGFNHFAFSQFLTLLADISLVVNSSIYTSEFTEIENEIFKNIDSSNFVSILNQAILYLKEIVGSSRIDDIISEYYYQLDSYLQNFPEYLYLDIAICLPDSNDANLLVETKYYGFIRETLELVDKEIRNKFFNIPILLHGDSKNIVNCEINNDDIQKHLQKYI